MSYSCEFCMEMLIWLSVLLNLLLISSLQFDMFYYAEGMMIYLDVWEKFTLSVLLKHTKISENKQLLYVN